ncbi:hypothetical protein NDU88_007075 [Pleurodeles waltl]|uniref:Uncharacterized protein n=1 Tax=Pleurodeles waltl TaxID=8319 RepID=A0AAV7NAI5_PLEWA|nr:hypothetical protein NDU88_007075 [Pleurodeles waltl]
MNQPQNVGGSTSSRTRDPGAGKGEARRSGARSWRSSVRPGEDGAEAARRGGHRGVGGTEGPRRCTGPLGPSAAWSRAPPPPTKQRTELELPAPARADPAESRTGEIK